MSQSATDTSLGLPSPLTRRTYPWLSLVLATGFTLRLLGLNRSIWFDEYATLQIINSEPFLAALRLDDHPPLYYALLRSWAAIHQDVVFLRLLSVVFGLGTLSLVILWLRRYSPLAAALSGLLVATLPILLRYSQELRVYPMLLFSTALAFYGASRVAAQSRSRRAYLWLGLGLTLAVLSHLIGAMVITTLVVFLLVQRPDLTRLRWKWLAAAIGIPSLTFVGYYRFFTLHDYSNWWMPPLSLELVAETLRSVFSVPSLFWPVVVASTAAPSLARPADVLIKGLLVTVGVLVVIGGDWRKSWPLLAAATFFWFQIVAYSFVVTPVFWYRTLLPGLIPFIAWLGVQTATIRRPLGRTIAIVGLVLLSTVFVTHWTVTRAWASDEGFLELARDVDAEWRPDDVLIFYPSYMAGPVGFYLQRTPTMEGIPVDLGGDVQPLLDKAAAAQQAGRRVFVAVREDVNAKRDRAYPALLQALEAVYGLPASTRRYGLIYLQVYGASP